MISRNNRNDAGSQVVFSIAREIPERIDLVGLHTSLPLSINSIVRGMRKENEIVIDRSKANGRQPDAILMRYCFSLSCLLLRDNIEISSVAFPPPRAITFERSKPKHGVCGKLRGKLA